MKQLGELERRVMDIVWDSPDPVPAPIIAGQLPHLAYTTVMTMLHRLGKKGLVSRHRADRSFSYSASVSRATYTAGLMRDALNLTGNHSSALAEFVNNSPREDQENLQEALNELRSRQQP